MENLTGFLSLSMPHVMQWRDCLQCVLKTETMCLFEWLTKILSFKLQLQLALWYLEEDKTSCCSGFHGVVHDLQTLQTPLLFWHLACHPSPVSCEFPGEIITSISFRSGWFTSTLLHFICAHTNSSSTALRWLWYRCTSCFVGFLDRWALLVVQSQREQEQGIISPLSILYWPTAVTIAGGRQDYIKCVSAREKCEGSQGGKVKTTNKMPCLMCQRGKQHACSASFSYAFMLHATLVSFLMTIHFSDCLGTVSTTVWMCKILNQRAKLHRKELATKPKKVLKVWAVNKRLTQLWQNLIYEHWWSTHRACLLHQ